MTETYEITDSKGSEGTEQPDATRTPLVERRSVVWGVRALTLVVILGAWEWFAADVSRALFAPPSEIAVAFYEMTFVERIMMGPLLQSLLTMVIGLSLVVVIGVPLGIWMGRNRILEWALDPYVTFLYVLPSISFIPLLVVWLGFDWQLRIVLVLLAGVFPLIINTVAGVRNVDSEYIDGGRSFTATERQIVRTVILPGSLPFIFAGLRIAFASAWVGVIVAEMTALLSGIGGVILHQSYIFSAQRMIVPIIYIMMIGIAIQGLFNLIQKRLTPWQTSA